MIKNILTPILFLSVLACSGVKVLDSESADGFTLGNYKTFNFYEVEGSGDTTSNYQKNVVKLEDAIAKQLQARGLQKSTTDPDLLVNIGTVVQEKIQTRETTLQDAPRYMGQRNYSWKSEQVEVSRYKEGTVTVHLVEKATKKMVWKGAAQSVLPAKQEDVQKTIDEGMTALFKDVP